MLELADRLLPLLRAGASVALATAVDVLGSSPSTAGTSMALTGDGRTVGSVSGGCVEAAALEACGRLLAGGEAGVRRFGFGDGAAARAGLACGGELDVLVHGLGGPGPLAEFEAAAAGRPAALAVVTAGPPALLGRSVCGGEGAGAEGDLTDTDLTGSPGASVSRVRAALAARTATGRSGEVAVECGAEVLRLFVDVSAPAARMVLVGATDLAAALTAAATAVGYRVTVVDPRPAFACADRVPGAEVLSGLPHEVLPALPLDARSVVCVLSHDEDLDPLALAAALEGPAGFVGALGSRATHARRRTRLAALGVTGPAIDRIRAPVGLDLGASTPAETAVSILAEVLRARSSTTGASLAGLTGAIHRTP